MIRSFPPLFLLLPSLVTVAGLGRIAAQDRAESVATVEAAIEHPVELTLPYDTTTRVVFAPNPFDVTEVLLTMRGRNRLRMEIDKKGWWISCIKLHGLVKELGRAPCAVIAGWQHGEDGLALTLCLSASNERVGSQLRKIEEEDLLWSASYTSFWPHLLEPPSEVERVAGFVRLWSEVKYNFASFDRVPELDWERVLDDYLPRVQRAESAAAYYRILRECMALLRDGYSDVWGPSDEPTANLPIALAEIEGKAIVVAVWPMEEVHVEAKQRELALAELRVGDELLKIDGVSVADRLREHIHPYISASTPQQLALRAYPKLCEGQPGTVARLELRSLDGALREVALTRGYLAAQLPQVAHQNGEVTPGVVYHKLSSLGGSRSVKEFEAGLPKIRAARGLILDLRDSAGELGGSGAKILAHLTDQPIPQPSWKSRLYRPVDRIRRSHVEWLEGRYEPVRPAADPFLGPVVVLMGARTDSAAERFLVALKAASRATLVGEPTAGSTGPSSWIEDLPGRCVARVSVMRETFPDGTEFVGVGVLPDVDVRPTAQDLAAGRDVVFERGVAELRRLMRR